jgi:hypothetical protein
MSSNHISSSGGGYCKWLMAMPRVNYCEWLSGYWQSRNGEWRTTVNDCLAISMGKTTVNGYMAKGCHKWILAIWLYGYVYRKQLWNEWQCGKTCMLMKTETT